VLPAGFAGATAASPLNASVSRRRRSSRVPRNVMLKRSSTPSSTGSRIAPSAPPAGAPQAVRRAAHSCGRPALLRTTPRAGSVEARSGFPSKRHVDRGWAVERAGFLDRPSSLTLALQSCHVPHTGPHTRVPSSPRRASGNSDSAAATTLTSASAQPASKPPACPTPSVRASTTTPVRRLTTR